MNILFKRKAITDTNDSYLKLKAAILADLKQMELKSIGVDPGYLCIYTSHFEIVMATHSVYFESVRGCSSNNKSIMDNNKYLWNLRFTQRDLEDMLWAILSTQGKLTGEIK